MRSTDEPDKASRLLPVRLFCKASWERYCSLRNWNDRILRWRDRFERVDFSTIAMPEELGLDPRESNHSSPSDNRPLRRVLRDLPINAGDRIIDIGCGKGSAMRLMLRFPFAAVHGLEISPQLAAIARQNFSRLRLPESRWQVFTGSAGNFHSLDTYNYVYLYNPFGPSTMQRFLHALAESLERLPRPLTLIYANPVWKEQVKGLGVLQLQRDHYRDTWGDPIFVYSTNVDGRGVAWGHRGTS